MIGRVRWELSVFVFALLACPVRGQALQVTLVKGVQVLDWLREFPESNADRAERLAKLFGDAGCPEVTRRPVKSSKVPNVICTLRGDSDEVILVGAHFDKVDKGKGIIDNGSGTVLLPALFRALASQKRRHTLIFVGFAAEEDGLVGSRQFAKAIPKPERSRYRAMVNLDSLALGPVTVWHKHSDAQLRTWFEEVHVSLKPQAKIEYVDLQLVGDGDSTSFKQLKIPVIDFHSVRPDSFAVLHSDQDDWSAVKESDYTDAYRLVAYFLAYLDVKIQPAPSATQ